MHDLFARQRQAESAGVPSFTATVAAAQLRARQRLARRGLWAYGAVSVAAVALVASVTMRAWFIRPPAVKWSAPLGVQLSSVTWNSPTDFLLKTPDAAALHSVPRLVQLPRLTPAPSAPVTDTND